MNAHSADGNAAVKNSGEAAACRRYEIRAAGPGPGCV